MRLISPTDADARSEAAREQAPLPEHGMIEINVSLVLQNGRVLPSGATGAIVFVHGFGAAYEVEFLAPFSEIATVEASKLSPVRIA